jgi:peptidoglycan/LPS O-acetylase OafA/YrhL
MLWAAPMGALRIYLAMTVLAWHDADAYQAVVPNSFSAVYMFFIVSGFYMSLILNGKYDSVGRFWLARVLRLYPTYLTVLAVALITSSAGLTHDPFRYDHWLDQMLILPPVIRTQFQESGGLNFGQMYTVGLELMFYALAPWLVRRRLAVLLTLFGVAAVAHALPYFLGLPSRIWQYECFPAILVFFLAGALAFRLYRRIEAMPIPPWVGYGALLALVVYGGLMHAHTRDNFTNDPWSISLYVLAAVTIPFLFHASRKSRIDQAIGSLSYPFYVAHALVIWLITGPVLNIGYDPVWAFALSLAASIALVLLVERPLEPLRQWLAVPRPIPREQATAPAE